MIDLHQLALSTAIACALAAGIAAQTSSTPPATTPPDQMTTVTVTGCVQRNATPSVTSGHETAGTSGVRPGASFILADARGSAASSATPEGAVVTSTIAVYQLSGD